MKIYSVAIILFSLLSSCKNTNEVIGKSNSNKKEQQEKNYEILRQEPYGGLSAYELRVIKSEDDLSKVYDIINAKRKPDVESPKIDFSKETVVAIFIGQRNTGGYSIKINSVEKVDSQVVLSFAETFPKPGEMVTMAICNPYSFVKIPYSKEEIIIKEEK